MWDSTNLVLLHLLWGPIRPKDLLRGWVEGEPNVGWVSYHLGKGRFYAFYVLPWTLISMRLFKTLRNKAMYHSQRKQYHANDELGYDNIKVLSITYSFNFLKMLSIKKLCSKKWTSKKYGFKMGSQTGTYLPRCCKP